jgi:hypothetical protein
MSPSYVVLSHLSLSDLYCTCGSEVFEILRAEVIWARVRIRSTALSDFVNQRLHLHPA